MSTPDHEQLISAAVELLTSALSGSYKVFDNSLSQTAEQGDRIRREYLTGDLMSYHASTLQKIIDMRADNLYYWHYLIIDRIVRKDVLLNEEFVSDYLNLSHCIKETDLNARTAKAIIAFASLEHYENLTPNDLAHDYPEQRIAQGTAILATVSRMVESGIEGIVSTAPFTNHDPAITSVTESFSDNLIHYIRDDRLRNLLTDDDSDPEAITKVITDRDLFNYDDIIAILEAQRDNPAPVLREGVL